MSPATIGNLLVFISDVCVYKRHFFITENIDQYFQKLSYNYMFTLVCIKL